MVTNYLFKKEQDLFPLINIQAHFPMKYFCSALVNSGNIHSMEQKGCHSLKVTALTVFYYKPSSEILEFPSVINFDIITSDNINFHFLL